MATPPQDLLVVGISSTALFDLTEAARVFDEGGIRRYREYMLAHVNDSLAPGTGMPLVKALLGLKRSDSKDSQPLVEVVVMSQNSPETGVCITNNVRALGLSITRFAFTGGEALANYIEAYHIDLFLSRDERDVQRVIDSGTCAAALLYDPPSEFEPVENQVRIAFDADAVLFSDASELIFRQSGLKGFQANEDHETDVPLEPGPYANFLRKLAVVKQATDEDQEYSPVRLAVVTARNAPAEQRVITTFRTWGVYVDAAFFLGGWDKTPVLQAFRPHVFFDDQDHHVQPAALVVPAGRVPYNSRSPLVTAESEPEPEEVGVPLRRSAADVRVPPTGSVETGEPSGGEVSQPDP